jgi:uncharacterized protein DUF4340
MRLRPGPTAAVILLVGMGVWVYMSEFRGAAERQKAGETKDRVFTFERADLKSLVIRNPQGTVRVLKEGNGWSVTEPIAVPADHDAVEGVLSSLEFARVEKRLGTGGDRKTYGLDPAPLAIAVETTKGPPVSIELGDTNPIGGAYFAALPGGALAVVSVSLGEVAKKDVFALRDKSLLAFDPFKVKSLVIERGRESIALEKREAGWTMTRPVTGPADGPTITDLLSALDRLRAARFVTEHPTPDDLKTWGLSPPAVRMTLMQEGWDATRTVEFGTGKADEHASRTVGRDAIVTIPTEFWPKASVALLDLRRRDVLGLSQYRLRSISVARAGGQALVMEKGDEGKWKVSGLATGTVAFDTVDALVRAIAGIKATSFDDAPAGTLTAALAANPAIDATFEQEPDAAGGTAPRQHLLFGALAKDGRMPVRDLDWPSIQWADGAALKGIGEHIDAVVKEATAPPAPAPGATPPEPGVTPPPDATPPGGGHRP